MSATPRKRQPAKRTTPPAKQSQRDRLLGRGRPTATYPVVVDQASAEAARAELEDAERLLRRLELRDRATRQEVEAARKRVDAAQSAVDDCCEILTLRALPPRRVEELAAEHPATEDQLAKMRREREQAQQRGDQLPEWPSYADTFWPAMLAESVDSDMTVEDWDTFLTENVSDGERRGLRVALLAVNSQERYADSRLPKGSTQILSSLLS